jgi:hypothetical protein
MKKQENLEVIGTESVGENVKGTQHEPIIMSDLNRDEVGPFAAGELTGPSSPISGGAWQKLGHLPHCLFESNIQRPDNHRVADADLVDLGNAGNCGGIFVV